MINVTDCITTDTDFAIPSGLLNPIRFGTSSPSTKET